MKSTVGSLGLRSYSGPGRLLTVRSLTIYSKDRAVLDGPAFLASAKYALRKGLPTAGKRRLAVENDPHSVDDFDGVIEEGYGKGRKTLVASGPAVVKVDDKQFVSRYNYHVHEADRAGLHYDLVVEGVKPGTPKWEVHIPAGPVKGRYAFVTSERGTLVVPMKDRGLAIAKPTYRLKSPEFLSNLGPGHTVEGKVDGSLANVVLDKNRAIFRSHRENGETYYDRIPHLEDISNRSRLLSCRLTFPGPDLNGTVLRGELVHPDGAARMGGILNASPEKAQQVQKLRGKAEFYAWDVVRYKGRDVSRQDPADRRQIVEDVVRRIHGFNAKWKIVAAAAMGERPEEFYRKTVSLGLPFGEGVVVKMAGQPWFKIKETETADLTTVGFLEGAGKYKGTLGCILVENPGNGARGEVGSFCITDLERDWIWKHRSDLLNQVVEVEMQEMTSRGVPRAGRFIRFHPDKSDQGLLMYNEVQT